MLAAYVDLKKAFDSVHREPLWDLLRLRGIPLPVLRDCKCCEVWRRLIQLLPCEYRCVLPPSLFTTCMDWVPGRVVERSHCEAFVCNTLITNIVFADDAAIFTESLELLVMALEALHEEVKPLGLKVSWAKTKVQVFGGVLDETDSLSMCVARTLRS